MSETKTPPTPICLGCHEDINGSPFYVNGTTTIRDNAMGLKFQVRLERSTAFCNTDCLHDYVRSSGKSSNLQD